MFLADETFASLNHQGGKQFANTKWYMKKETEKKNKKKKKKR